MHDRESRSACDMTAITPEDWLRNSHVSEVIDKCQEAGVNLKSRSITSRPSPLSRFSKLKRKYILRDMDQLGKERILSATENEAKR